MTARLARFPVRQRPRRSPKKPLRWIQRALALGIAVFLAGATVSQSAHAARQQVLHRYGLEMPKDSKTPFAQTVWRDYEDTGLHCRSTLDGSNPSAVRQVKARMADPAGFAHIVTTFWPRETGGQELTMMFRAGAGPGGGEVKEAHALVDPETCQARLLSIT
ncbi:MAG: hypothetical protein PHE36_05895 [Novosphingobium sp.]|nr:hypothetical protein [Novosphingobium sp.]